MRYNLVVYLEESEAIEYPLESSQSVGRNSSCDISIAVAFVSGYHCILALIEPDEENHYPYYLIKDGRIFGERSANGTWVNAKESSEYVRLRHGDVITFCNGSSYPRAIFIDNYVNNSDVLSDTSEHERSIQ